MVRRRGRGESFHMWSGAHMVLISLWCQRKEHPGFLTSLPRHRAQGEEGGLAEKERPDSTENKGWGRYASLNCWCSGKWGLLGLEI